MSHSPSNPNPTSCEAWWTSTLVLKDNSTVILDSEIWNVNTFEMVASKTRRQVGVSLWFIDKNLNLLLSAYAKIHIYYLHWESVLSLIDLK